jgi:hypothetical protein
MTARFHPDIPDFATIRDAFESLEPTDAARWGTMDAPAMLEHVARFNEMYLGRVRVPGWTRVLARLFGGLFIRRLLATSPFETKRGMTTLPVLRVAAEGAGDARFEEARVRLLRTLDEIEAMSGEWDHPLYGGLAADMGKALVRHHAAHHLNQFGRVQGKAAR